MVYTAFQEDTVKMNEVIITEILWPKGFQELKTIDDSLKCGICKEYLKTCMLTPCGHSYCSICIRKSLEYATSCPVCWETTHQNTLRNNYTLDKITEIFLSIRDKLIKHLKIAAVHFDGSNNLKSPLPSQSNSKKETSIDEPLFNATPKRSTQLTTTSKSTAKGKINFSSSSKCNSTPKSSISKKLDSILPSSPNIENNQSLDEIMGMNQSEDVIENDNIKVPPMFLQPKVEPLSKPDQPSVCCPVCSVDIPERNINTHLDNCLANVGREPPKKSPEVQAIKPKRKPLQKMVWNLMAEKELRKKAKEYKLNMQGDKRILIERLKRYTLLYNVECDSNNPRPVEDILKQVDREEKLKDKNQQQLPRVNRKMDPALIEEENKKYLNENQNSFKKLIESMKERGENKIKPVSRTTHNRIESDEDEVEEEKSFINKPSTSRTLNCVDLCNSDEDERVSSPILGASSTVKKKTVNDIDTDSLSYVVLPSRSCDDRNKDCMVNQRRSSTPVCVSEVASPAKSYPSSPPRPLTPNCIITAHSDSDSEASFSILTHDGPNLDDNFLDDVPLTENIPANSQVNDPDFVVDADDLFESEELFEAPKRTSKRKHIKSPVTVDPNQVRSPRRSKRRVSK